MKGGYFLYNGRFFKESEPAFTLSDLKDRSEGFTEFFRAEHNEVLFLESVANHLNATAATIGMDLTGLIDPKGKLLRKDVSRLLNKNKLYLAAKIEIQVYRSADQINILLCAEEIDKGYYPVKEPGLLLSIYLERHKEIPPSQAYSTDGLIVRQSAGRRAEELSQPDMIILNSVGNCCESIEGSFALVNGHQVIFPAAGSGGYRCAILGEVIQSAKVAGFQVEEQDNITPEALMQAEELFLFDACNGIQKVLGLEDRRYFSPKTKLMAGKLSELAKKDRDERITN